MKRCTTDWPLGDMRRIHLCGLNCSPPLVKASHSTFLSSYEDWMVPLQRNPASEIFPVVVIAARTPHGKLMKNDGK
jgi:hypothetical protein